MDKPQRLKGAFHIHSNFSKDGESSLEELTQKAKALHYDFLVLTDHFEDMDEHKLNELITECKRLSSSYGLSIVPGVEVRLINGVHILVIGIKSTLKPFSIHDVESLRKVVKDQHALIGLAHLSHEPDLSLAELSKFDFIEGWNHRYDKRFPTLKTLTTAHALRNSCFIGGLDMHSIDELGSIWLETGESNIIDGIRNRAIITKNSFLELDQTCQIKRGEAIFFAFYWLSLSFQYVARPALKFILLNHRKPPKILEKLARIFLG